MACLIAPASGADVLHVRLAFSHIKFRAPRESAVQPVPRGRGAALGKRHEKDVGGWQVHEISVSVRDFEHAFRRRDARPELRA